MSRLQELLADIVNDSGPWDAATALRDIEGWDSLNHVRLVVGLESTFGVKLTADEIRNMTTIGDIERVLQGKGVDA